MKDRIVENPHRYQLIPTGESNTYDIIAKPGTITEEGTPINKATLLKDETAGLYGLPNTATVDDVLGAINDLIVAVAEPNGYLIAGDLIIQWGVTTASFAGVPVTFPIAFPNALFLITGNYKERLIYNHSGYGLFANSQTKTGFTFIMQGNEGIQDAVYIAIGC